MILPGSPRGGAGDLARHLMKRENDHIEVHEIRGFASEDLYEALHEAYALSKGTHCKQFLFSLSLNPPQDAVVSVSEFEDAIERAEKKLGLTGQPRVIVFHEKNGLDGIARRHAHAVWSRIDPKSMTAKTLPFHKRKLWSLSRELFLKHGWELPSGYIKKSERDPRNFTLAEWQQARRIDKDPRAIKEDFQDAWAVSDSKTAFAHALEERGYWIARGDRRGFVALDINGEVYSIPKKVGIRTKEVRARLGDEAELPSVAETKARIARELTKAADRIESELGEQQRVAQKKQDARKAALVRQQRKERRDLKERQEQRRIQEAKARQARFRRGLKGLWDRFTGHHRKIRKLNEREAQTALRRDQREREALIQKQLEQRRSLQETKREARRSHSRNRAWLENQRKTMLDMARDTPAQTRLEGPNRRR